MRKLLLLIISCVSFSLIQAQSQRSPQEEVIKEWAFIGESSTQLDVSYRLVKCAGTAQLHLQIFNESPNDQVAKFKIEITNVASGASVSRDITFAMKLATITQAECSNGDALKPLRIDIPSDYDLQNVRVKITFTL